MSIRDLVPRMGKRNLSTRAVSERDLFAFQREVNRLFDDVLGGGLFPGVTDPLFAPRTSVAETEKEVRVVAELPGMDEKDVTVEVDDDVIAIRGEKRDERDTKEAQWRLQETTYGRFERVLSLPAVVEGDKAKAVFKKGVLTVTLPKRPEAQRARKRIPVATD